MTKGLMAEVPSHIEVEWRQRSIQQYRDAANGRIDLHRWGISGRNVCAILAKECGEPLYRWEAPYREGDEFAGEEVQYLGIMSVDEADQEAKKLEKRMR